MKIYRHLIIVILLIIISFLISCDNNPANSEEIETGTLSDFDGNIYKTVKIGDQWWMAENLKVTHYRNGDSILNITNNDEWAHLDTSAYCCYNNDINNFDTYGCLYNWYAIGDNRNIAPEGWHVPSDEEWKILEMYIGLSQDEANSDRYRGTSEGKKLKAKSGWNSKGNGTDEFGFTVLPGGFRFLYGYFVYIGDFAIFWSSTDTSNNEAWFRELECDSINIYRGYYKKEVGFSMRLISDF